jgi:Tat protein translocase TatB subunit
MVFSGSSRRAPRWANVIGGGIGAFWQAIRAAAPLRTGGKAFGTMTLSPGRIAMPQIGPLEIVVIFVVALVVFGPNKLPEIGRQVGKAMGEVRKFQASFKRDLDEVMRDDDEPTPAPKLPPKQLTAGEPAVASPSPDAGAPASPEAGPAASPHAGPPASPHAGPPASPVADEPSR